MYYHNFIIHYLNLFYCSDTAEIHFGLNDYNTRDQYLKAIDEVRYKRGTTNTAAALQLLREEGFGHPGDRSNMKNIVVLFTDGGSNSFDKTIQEARKARYD